MKKILLILLLAGTILSCKTTANKEAIVLTVENKQGSDLTNVPVVFQATTLKHLPAAFTIISEGKEIPYQLDDFDADGNVDEIFLLADFKANSSKSFEFKVVAKKPIYPSKVDVTFAEIHPPHNACHSALRAKPTDSLKASDLYQMEGPAWENDIVGFRNYYDQRNAMDIFGKQISTLSLAKAGVDGQNYHELDTWGMDILHVGSSLGAGAIAIKKKGKIYRIATPEKSSFELISNGPLRAIFNLKHEHFKIGDHDYQINHQISIYAGVPFYESAVMVTGLQGDEELVTGMVNLHSDTLFTLQTDNQHITFATHDKQAEMDTYLGMAINVNKADFSSQVELPDKDVDITSSYAILLKLYKDKPTTFRFFANWENQDKKMADRKYFLESLQQDRYIQR